MPDAPHDTTISPAEALPPTSDTATTSTGHPFADPNPMTLGHGRRLYHQGRITHEWVMSGHEMLSRLEGMMEPPEKDMEPLTKYMAETTEALSTVLLTIRDIQTLTRRLGARMKRIEDHLEIQSN